ncbi:MAG: hypothetical protein RL042_2377 [Nitrospirota bacterium]|jgi:hypothetical protein
MRESSRALIARFGKWHKSPVLISVFVNSMGKRRAPLAVDNFVGHQLS